MTPRNVLIVGGGIAGLSLGIALANQGIRSTIFEIRPVPGDQGGSITLAPLALRVLDHSLGIYDRVKAAGYLYHRFGAYNDQGYKFGEVSTSEPDDGTGRAGYPSVRIMRGVLHKVLLDRYEEMRTLGKVIWGARIKSIQDEEDGVVARFEDGSSVTGDILIGADGIHSRVRTHILGSSSPTPSFAGTCTVNSFLPRSSISTPPEFSIPAMIFTPVGLVMLLPVDPKGQTVAWGLTEEIDDKNGRIGWKEYEESGEVIRVARRNYADVTTDPIRCLMDSMDEEKSNIRLWAHYSIPDLPVWHKGRVCLIGDAAHAFPPNGLGISMALEDSGILARLLSSDQAVKQGFDKLFSHFEIARRKRVESVKKSARSSGAIKSKTGPWGWWLKQWIFYAFFAWNGWLLRPPSLKSIYDVEEEDIEIE